MAVIKKLVKGAAKTAAKSAKRGVAAATEKRVVSGRPCGGCGKEFDGRIKHNKPECSRAAAADLPSIHDLELGEY
ncbi:hypothetical protein CFP71_42230 [Amycolatopsis thailandensis]|uniref:Uncharacterized protein n=1 Tax=Amycolatopsis thailandensis TaxID=589330 RepID=A0A229R8I1_9PSEU|nr:hypothetical protein [Amycolatopsis thailandensis]OXM42751.1 hypothetical protein CFP71_42230 [Amycolatopsis thailandensis]